MPQLVFEASLKSIIKPNKDSTKSYKPVNRIFITHYIMKSKWYLFQECKVGYLYKYRYMLAEEK